MPPATQTQHHPQGFLIVVHIFEIKPWASNPESRTKDSKMDKGCLSIGYVFPRSYYVTCANPNKAPQMGKFLKITIDVNCLIPPKMGFIQWSLSPQSFSSLGIKLKHFSPKSWSKFPNLTHLFQGDRKANQSEGSKFSITEIERPQTSGT